MNKETKISYTVMLTQKDIDFLKALAEENEVSVSEMVRRIVSVLRGTFFYQAIYSGKSNTEIK